MNVTSEHTERFKELLEEDSPYIAKERIKWLVSDIESGNLDAGKL